MKSQSRSISFYFVAAALLSAAAFSVACSGGGSGAAKACEVVGSTEACSCIGGAMGERVCGSDMTFGVCLGCPDPQPTVPDDGKCYRCLNDDPWAVECSETADRTDGTRACIAGDDVEACSTLSQCCMASGREATSAGSCVFPEADAIEFIRIEGGTFQMGGDYEYDGHPIHAVTLASFEMSKTEVTVGQYRVCVNAGACTVPTPGVVLPGPAPDWDDVPGGRENHPVVNVDWNQAKAFAEFVGARLPTEAEWEYAARSGGQDIAYPWGNEGPDCDRVNFQGSASQRYIQAQGCVVDTTPVCTYATGNTAQGLCDMAGNVREWIEDDWHDSYEGAPNDGSAWVDNPRGSNRVVRGCSWRSPYFPGGDNVRAAYRHDRIAEPTVEDATYASSTTGFRLARSAP